MTNKEIIGKKIRQKINMPIIEASHNDEELYDYFSDQLHDDGTVEAKMRIKSVSGYLQNDQDLIFLLTVKTMV